MYWINLAALERQMVDDHYTEKSTFHYFLAYFILSCLSLTIDLDVEGLYKLGILPYVLLTIWGSYAIFNKYKKNDGKDFFPRYWGLSWVIGFRLMLIFIPLILILGPLSLYTLSNYIIKEPFIPNWNWFEIAFSLLYIGLFYLLLKRSFKRVAKKQPLKQGL